jgi:hypothetical protein
MGALETYFTGPAAATDLQVSWGRRAGAMPAHAQDYLEQRWQAHLAEARLHGKTLFDGPVTLLQHHAVADGQLRLEVTGGTYREFLVTTLRDREWFLSRAPQAMSPALGNSVLLTHGPRAVLGVRSRRVSAYAGHGHVFGGVLDLPPQPEGPVPHALLLDHLLRELHEELHVQPHELAGQPELLGFYRDTWLMQPELVWQWEIETAPEELARRIPRDEHDGLLALAATDTAGVPLTPVTAAACAHWWGRQRA